MIQNFHENQLVGSLSHYLQEIYIYIYIPGGFLDFWNQQDETLDILGLSMS